MIQYGEYDQQFLYKVKCKSRAVWSVNNDSRMGVGQSVVLCGTDAICGSPIENPCYRAYLFCYKTDASGKLKYFKSGSQTFKAEDDLEIELLMSSLFSALSCSNSLWMFSIVPFSNQIMQNTACRRDCCCSLSLRTPILYIIKWTNTHSCESLKLRLYQVPWWNPSVCSWIPVLH